MSDPFIPSVSLELRGSAFMVARNALQHLGYRFSLDRRSSRIVYSLPGKNRRNALTLGARAAIRVAINLAIGFDPGKTHIDDAIQSLAHSAEFDPVVDRLRKLPEWDGEKRLEKLFTHYLEGEDTELNRRLGELWAVAAVRRALQPGCAFDLVPVIYGKGGVGKSKSLRILAIRSEWHSDADLLDRDPERQMEQIDGVWIFELAELVGHKRRAEIERQKAFISRTTDRCRRVYERDREEKPRAFVLIATSDKEHFLFDNNNRRFVPVKVIRTRRKELRRDRDQLWAEALALEANFGPLVLPRRLWAASAEQQAKVKEVDPWLDPLSGLQGTKSGALVFVTNAQVHAVLGLSPGRQTPETYQRVTACMVDLGWASWSGRDSKKRMARGFKRRVSSS